MSGRLVINRACSDGEKVSVRSVVVEEIGLLLLETGGNSMQAMIVGGMLASELHRATYIGEEAERREDFMRLCGEWYDQATGKLFGQHIERGNT